MVSLMRWNFPFLMITLSGQAVVIAYCMGIVRRGLPLASYLGRLA